MLLEADIVPQALVHAQLTGDDSLLEKAAPFIEGGWSHLERIPEGLRQEIREALVGAMTAAGTGEIENVALTQQRLCQLLSYGVNDLVSDDYGSMFLEEAAPLLGKMRTG